jgi:hypothetical protein
MKISRIFAFALVLAGGLAISAGAARAQAVAAAAAAEAASPIIRVLHKALSRPKLSGDWMKAEVIHFDSHSIIVSQIDNPRMIHTFTYATNIQNKMQQLEDKGGYQWGDRVKILYEPGNTVALKINGKPSKPQ